MLRRKLLVITLLLLSTAAVAIEEDGKEYKTYVRDGHPVYYCIFDGIGIEVYTRPGNLFEPHILITNMSGKDFLFEPKKIKAYCYAVDNYPKETRNILKRYFDLKWDLSLLTRDSLQVYSKEEYRKTRDSQLMWNSILSLVMSSAIEGALVSNTPEKDYWIRLHGEANSAEGVTEWMSQVKTIDDDYWQTNTIMNMTSHRGFIGIKRRKADHIVLEIPVNGELFTFLIRENN